MYTTLLRVLHLWPANQHIITDVALCQEKLDSCAASFLWFLNDAVSIAGRMSGESVKDFEGTDGSLIGLLSIVYPEELSKVTKNM